MQEHLNTFLAEAEARSVDAPGLPRSVKGAFRRYLDCGLLQKASTLPMSRLRPRSAGGMGLDPLGFPRCGGRLDFEGCVEDPDEIRAWLRDSGEPEDPPPLSPARPPPQSRFEFDQAG